MGRRIEDLIGLGDSPIEEPDLRDTTWGRFLQEIDDLLETGDYSWAETTLKGIAESVEQRRWVTDGQRQAVKNISAARKDGRPRFGGGRGGGRRYEGYR